MAGYKWDKFGGLRPLATVLRLQPNESTNALNVDLHRGVLRPRVQQTGWSSALHPSLLLAAEVASFTITAGFLDAGGGTTYTGFSTGNAIGSITENPTHILDYAVTAFQHYVAGSTRQYQLILTPAAPVPFGTQLALDRLVFIGDDEQVTTLDFADADVQYDGNPTSNIYYIWDAPTSQISNTNTYAFSIYASAPLDEPATLFRFHDRSNSDSFWMYWKTDVDVAPGPVENAEQRHYYTGDGAPKLFTKDSIDDSTPPYPQAADTKYPMTWYYLGVPAPTAAPTIDGTSYVPPDTAKSGSITGLVTSHFTIRFTPRQPSNQSGAQAMEANGNHAVYGTPMYADSSAGAQVLQVMDVGTRVKVTAVVDTDTVTVVGTVGTGFFEELPKFHDDPVPTNIMDERWDWYYASPADKPAHFDTTKLHKVRNGKDNDDCWIYLIPDGVNLTVPSHSLKVGDVLRVVSVSTPMRYSTPTRILAGAPYDGSNYNKGRKRDVTDPNSATITFAGDLAYFVERDGREFDPTIEDTVVAAREPTTRSYVYTYVTSLGEEGPPSPPTDPFTLALGDSVSIEGFTAPPTEHRDITLFRLYRTNTGTQETAFQFVADVPIASSSYSDALADDELGEVLQSETWEPPPADMLGICAMPNGFLAGFFDNVLCFSEPGFPHAWPVDYRMPLDVEIVGIKVAGGSLIVATKGTPYVVAGTHPRQMASRRVEDPSPCVDKRSMVDCGDTIIYASTDGLISANSTGFSNITEQFFTREQWQEVVGAVEAESHSVRAWYADSEYVMQYAQNGAAGYVFDFRGEKLQITNTQDAWRAAFNDPKDGELYYVPSASDVTNLVLTGAIPDSSVPILRWRYLYPTTPPSVFDGSGVSHALYNSGRVVLPRPMAISVVKVLCRRGLGADFTFGRLKLSLSGYRYDSSSDYSTRFEPYHGTELCFETLIDGSWDALNWPGEQRARPFRIQPNVLVDALDFYVDMFGEVEVEAIYVAESFDDLLGLEG